MTADFYSARILGRTLQKFTVVEQDRTKRATLLRSSDNSLTETQSVSQHKHR